MKKDTKDIGDLHSHIASAIDETLSKNLADHFVAVAKKEKQIDNYLLEFMKNILTSDNAIDEILNQKFSKYDKMSWKNILRKIFGEGWKVFKNILILIIGAIIGAIIGKCL